MRPAVYIPLCSQISGAVKRKIVGLSLRERLARVFEADFAEFQHAPVRKPEFVPRDVGMPEKEIKSTSVVSCRAAWVNQVQRWEELPIKTAISRE